MNRKPVSRRLILQGLLGGAAAAFIACTSDDEPDPTATAEPPPTGSAADPASSPTQGPGPAGPAPSATTQPAPDPALEHKVGQMVMLGFAGTTMQGIDTIADAISQDKAGNLVLFDRNVTSPSQMAALTSGLTSLAGERPLISMDQEGGEVARLRPDKGFPATVSALALGSGDPAATRQAAAEMASTLREAGINLNLAPVVDVNVNPANPAIGYYGRSFSADPEAVAEHALAYIRGHHDQGVLTTMKHFPGHGSSTADSHLGFVDVSTTWSRDELIPFRRVIEAGEADAVMTAHIFNSQINADYPATLAPEAITGILREELGFEGVVITDDMQMGAIRQYYGFEEAIELAILAGADMIAVANSLAYDPQLPFKTFDAVMRAVQQGSVTEERIDQSYRRIQALKARLP